MRIKNSYRVELSEQFIKLLEELDISYEILYIFTPPIIQFVLFNDDARKKDIDSHLPPWHIIIPKLIFSKSEYEDATWYRFMPKYDKIPTTDSSLTYSFFCKYSDGTVNYNSTHKRQIGYYRLSQSPRWPKKVCILSGEGNYNQKWFTNDITRALLENSGIRGLRFDPVFMEKKDLQLANTWQIVFQSALPEESLVIGKEYGIKNVISCESCGEKRYYVCPQTYQVCLYNRYLGNQDAYITQATFGDGYGYNIVIGSKYFYMFLKKNSLDKYFNIHPVNTINEE